MKTVWIGMMAVTILLGTGIVVVVLYALGKIIFSYSRSVRLSKSDV